jgi:hypothetical protein
MAWRAPTPHGEPVSPSNGRTRRWASARSAAASIHKVGIKPVRSWPMFAANEDSSQQFQVLGYSVKESFVHTPCPSRIILGIALAGTGSGPGIGRAAVTSRRGFGSHDLRGRPTGRHSYAKRQCFVEGRRIIRASLSMECTWSGARDRSTVATDTGRAGMGVPVLIRIRAVLSCPPVFPTTAMARAETQRGKGEAHAGGN